MRLGRPSDKDRVRKWQSRVTSACKVYDAWFRDYSVDVLKDLYLGDHEGAGETNVNLCYPSIETRLSMMTVDRPYFRIEAKAPRADDKGSTIENRNKLREDTLNCKISDPAVGFVAATDLGVKESHWAFAVAEVVYSNDFIDNPNAQKPALNDTVPDESGVEEIPAAPLPDPKNKDGDHELVRVKRISPECWRVSLNAGNSLGDADWCGYYEHHRISDVKANKKYSNTSSLKPTGVVKAEYVDPVQGEANESKEGMVKLWKIWDIRTSKRYVFAEEGERFLLEEDYDIFPFEDLKLHEIPDEYYPLPVMFNWLGPQRGLTKTRKAQDEFLSTTKDKYIYRDGAIDEGELQKLEQNKQNVYAKANGGVGALTDVIAPITRPPMDASFWRNIPASKEDFVQVSAVSSEQRGVPDSNTATQANIVDINSKRREVKDATKIANWMARVAKKVLVTIQKRMALPFWVLTNVDPTGPNALEEAAGVVKTWKEITAEVLGDLNYEVSMEVESLSPISNQEDQQRWQHLVGLLGPLAVPVMANSRLILGKVTGFKSDRDLTEATQALQTVIKMQQEMAQQAQQAKQGGDSGAQGLDGVMQALAQKMGGPQ